MLDEIGRLAFLSSIKRDIDLEHLNRLAVNTRHKRPFNMEILKTGSLQNLYKRC
jgi:hypothetical protein